jgi:hypothetical protein
MEDFIQGIRNMSNLEKVLAGVTLGGILVNKAIPSEYARAEAISLGVAGLSCLAFAVKSYYDNMVNIYPLNEEDLYSSD